MKIKRLPHSLLALTFIGLSSCGSDGLNLDTLSDSLAQETASQIFEANTNTVSESAEADLATVGNPLVTSTQLFGSGGNLYKPVSDADALGAGNLVVLFDSSFTNQFESCSIPLADGTTGNLSCIDDQPFTQIPFSCFSNGNRQTWRANFRCEAVGSVVVTCLDFNQEVIFTAPAGQTGAICSRFG